MGWWITLGILFLLAILPLGVSIHYNSDGAIVKIILGPIKLTVVPAKKKPPKERRKRNPRNRRNRKSRRKSRSRWVPMHLRLSPSLRKRSRAAAFLISCLL